MLNPKFGEQFQAIHEYEKNLPTNTDKIRFTVKLWAAMVSRLQPEQVAGIFEEARSSNEEHMARVAAVQL